MAVATSTLRIDSLLRLVSSRLMRVNPEGAVHVWSAPPWLTPNPATIISGATVVGALVVTVRLLTAVVPLFADRTWSRLTVAPSSAIV